MARTWNTWNERLAQLQGQIAKAEQVGAGQARQAALQTAYDKVLAKINAGKGDVTPGLAKGWQPISAERVAANTLPTPTPWSPADSGVDTSFAAGLVDPSSALAAAAQQAGGGYGWQDQARNVPFMMAQGHGATDEQMAAYMAALGMTPEQQQAARTQGLTMDQFRALSAMTSGAAAAQNPNYGPSSGAAGSMPTPDRPWRSAGVPEWWEPQMAAGQSYITAESNIGRYNPDDPLSATHTRAVMLSDAMEQTDRNIRAAQAAGNTEEVARQYALLYALQREARTNRQQRSETLGYPAFIDPTNFERGVSPTGEVGPWEYNGTTGGGYTQSISEQDILDWYRQRYGVELPSGPVPPELLAEAQSLYGRGRGR